MTSKWCERDLRGMTETGTERTSRQVCWTPASKRDSLDLNSSGTVRKLLLFLSEFTVTDAGLNLYLRNN